ESVEVSVAVLLRRQGFKLPWAARSKSSVLAATASYDTSCARLVGERAANFETADRDAGEASRVVATVTTEQANPRAVLVGQNAPTVHFLFVPSRRGGRARAPASGLSGVDARRACPQKGDGRGLRDFGRVQAGPAHWTSEP